MPVLRDAGFEPGRNSLSRVELYQWATYIIQWATTSQNNFSAKPLQAVQSERILTRFLPSPGTKICEQDLHIYFNGTVYFHEFSN